MTELKALGKKPPEYEDLGICTECYNPDGCDCVEEHYRQVLLEAADEIEKRDRRFFTFPWIEKLVKNLRISAGVEEE